MCESSFNLVKIINPEKRKSNVQKECRIASNGEKEVIIIGGRGSI